MGRPKNKTKVVYSSQRLMFRRDDIDDMKTLKEHFEQKLGLDRATYPFVIRMALKALKEKEGLSQPVMETPTEKVA